MITESTLMQAFGFDEADLQANRIGEVSPRQRDLLDGLYQSRRGWWWQTIAIILGIQAVGAVIALVTGNVNLHDLPYVLLLIIPLSLIFVLNTLYSWSINRRLQTGEVSTAEGTAHLTQTYSRGEIYMLRLGRKRFSLMSGGEYQALEEGKSYRLYYVASVPEVVLSIEKLD